MSEPNHFIETGPLADQLVDKYRKHLAVRFSRDVVRWVLMFRFFTFRRNYLEKIYFNGTRLFPLREEPAPIIGFSHKKIHDVWVIIDFLLARSITRFHDFSLVGQAGLFTPIYPYRDLVPLWMKRFAITRFFAVIFSRIWGRFMNRVFRDIHVKPVFREGSDIPLNEEDYNHPNFAGPALFKMKYEEFKKYAAAETHKSFHSVQKGITEENQSFIILPEGIYKHNGAIADIQAMVGITAMRKKRNIILVSLTYDELCPDRKKRINAWVNQNAPLPPPAGKAELKTYPARVGDILQKNSVITASQLIAMSALHLENNSFNLETFEEFFHELAEELVNSPFVYDPGLQMVDYRQDRLRRFYKRFKNQWFRDLGKGKLEINQRALASYDHESRTCNDVLWNANNGRHFMEWRLGRGERET